MRTFHPYADDEFLGLRVYSGLCRSPFVDSSRNLRVSVESDDWGQSKTVVVHEREKTPIGSGRLLGWKVLTKVTMTEDMMISDVVKRVAAVLAIRRAF